MAASKIDEIHIQNFKFFPELVEPIKLGGNHLLLYGENGSGKSSIYWALYTLLECANKQKVKEIKKYFDPEIKEQQRLVNVHCPENLESYIKIKLTDESDFYVSFNDTSINENQAAKESNYSSDFITYRNLLSLYNFAHSEPINLIHFFSYAILPYVKFGSIEIKKEDISGAGEIFKYVDDGLKKIKDISNDEKLRYPRIDEPEYKDYIRIKNHFVKELNTLLTAITAKGNKILKDKLNYDFTFSLSLKQINKNNKKPQFSIRLRIPEYSGKQNVVYRPHSFLNEAKLTALGLAMRLAVLERSLSADSKLSLLVLDDLLISLDMSNRDKVIDLIIKDYQNDYQLIFLTHDKVLFHFIASKISNQNEWSFKEMYVGNNKPIIIDSKLSYIEKARNYFDSFDYVSTSLYIRKEIEKMVVDRLPEEYKRTITEKPHQLEHLWRIMVERYEYLSHPISEELKDNFKQTKLMVLNPQAHHSLLFPVYKIELEKAFHLIDLMNNELPLVESIILIKEDSKLIFKHPVDNYEFIFTTLSSLYLEKLNGNEQLVVPKCRIIKWQYNNTDFWDFKSSTQKIPSKTMEHKLDKIRETLTDQSRVPLSITYDEFIENTTIDGSIWSLKEILTKINHVI